MPKSQRIPFVFISKIIPEINSAIPIKVTAPPIKSLLLRLVGVKLISSRIAETGAIERVRLAGSIEERTVAPILTEAATIIVLGFIGNTPGRAPKPADSSSSRKPRARR